MKNYVQPGDVVTFTAPAGGVISGGGYKIGQIFCVATNNIAAGSPFEGQITGVVELAKNVTQALTEGALCYWDAAAARVTTTGAGNLLIGCATRAALAADATAFVRLNATARADGV